MIGRKLRARQIESALQLVGPMGEMIELMHEVILAHHPAGVAPDQCPVCAARDDDMTPILERWGDVRAKVMEHWDV